MVEFEKRWSTYQLFLAGLMVTTGTLNTLSAKWADMMEANHAEFRHPFLQALCMFIGEFLCLPVFFISRFFENRRSVLVGKESPPDEKSQTPLESEHKPFNPLIFLPATICDMVATSVMFIGLTLTNASSYQMLRGIRQPSLLGATIIFTGLLSVAFLGSVLRWFKWTGMFFVLCGLILVGLADLINDTPKDPNGMLSGDLLVILAQIVVAVQMVYEQKFLCKYNVYPLLAVGLEGAFGVILMIIVCVVFYFVKVPRLFTVDPEMRLENVLFALYQIEENNLIVVALIGLILSIAFFNFAGISVTKELSATTRMVLDSIRVFFIWAVSLAVGWQHFAYLQLIGFIVLLTGMCLYNDILLRPAFYYFRRKPDGVRSQNRF